MQIKAWLKKGTLPLIAVAFASAAWGLAQLIPASARLTRWEKAAAEITPTASTAAICAVANVHFSVSLTAADVAVMRQLVQTGTSCEEALRVVVLYARGRMEKERSVR